MGVDSGATVEWLASTPEVPAIAAIFCIPDSVTDAEDRAAAIALRIGIDPQGVVDQVNGILPGGLGNRGICIGRQSSVGSERSGLARGLTPLRRTCQTDRLPYPCTVGLEVVRSRALFPGFRRRVSVPLLSAAASTNNITKC